MTIINVFLTIQQRCIQYKDSVLPSSVPVELMLSICTIIVTRINVHTWTYTSNKLSDSHFGY